jgi:hypothetical protein
MDIVTVAIKRIVPLQVCSKRFFFFLGLRCRKQNKASWDVAVEVSGGSGNINSGNLKVIDSENFKNLTFGRILVTETAKFIIPHK